MTLAPSVPFLPAMTWRAASMPATSLNSSHRTVSTRTRRVKWRKISPTDCQRQLIDSEQSRPESRVEREVDMTKNLVSRRTFLAGTAGAVAAGTLAPQAQAQLGMPKSPVAINLVDVGGALALVQKPIENFRAAKPNLASRITFTKAPAPELPGKLKAQQDAGRVDIDVVLSGTDAISAGMEQGLWVKILPDYAAKFPNLEENYLPGALDMQKPTEGQAILVVFAIAGPMLEYAPERVKDVPKTTDALLAWCKAHPN